jgi:hypothetical protein
MGSELRAAATLALLALVVAAAPGCGAISRGGRLSDRGQVAQTIYLTTGGSPRKFKTLGFVQVRGYGVEVAGLQQVGHAALDPTIKGVLATEAAKMGGDAVIHIEFLDENPSTDAERMQAAAETAASFANPEKGPQVQQKDRYVTATGEIIQFLE